MVSGIILISKSFHEHLQICFLPAVSFLIFEIVTVSRVRYYSFQLHQYEIDSLCVKASSSYNAMIYQNLSLLTSVYGYPIYESSYPFGLVGKFSILRTCYGHW